MIHLVLSVVGRADVLPRPVRMTSRQRRAGKRGIHEDLDDSAAQTVGDIVPDESPTRRLDRRGEKAHPSAHLVNRDRQHPALVGQPVHLGALRHHHRVAHAGHPVREMAPRVLLDQAGHDIRPKCVDMRAHRRVMHRVDRPLPEHAVRFTVVVAANLPAPRVGRVTVDPGERQRGRVRVTGVIREVHHTDRVPRGHLVQIRAPAAPRWPCRGLRRSGGPRSTVLGDCPRRPPRSRQARPACRTSGGTRQSTERGSNVVIEKWLCGSQNPGTSARPRAGRLCGRPD